MQKLNNVEMNTIEGGADYTLCGIGVALTIGSFIYAPYLTLTAAEVTVAACASGQ